GCRRRADDPRGHRPAPARLCCTYPADECRAGTYGGAAPLSMSRVILLDAGPLGIVTKRRGVPDAEACRAWVPRCLRQGALILVPAIAHYEGWRWLERVHNAIARAR